MKRIINALNRSYNAYATLDEYRLGALNDVVLANLVENIRKSPSLDNFIIFTNCVNYFYSTRLQAAVTQEYRSLNTRNKVIIRAAKVLESAWKDNVIRLNKEKQGGKVNVEKVEWLRQRLDIVMKRGSYSFTTKVFHQLNSQYPILDARVNQFMKLKILDRRINFYNHNNSFSVFYNEYILMMKKLKWAEDQVNELDNAIWVYHGKYIAKSKIKPITEE